MAKDVTWEPYGRFSDKFSRGLTQTICSAALLTTTILATNTAWAQAKIEQMVVTAQKRAQDIQSVPASISAFSGEGLESRQVKSVADLATATPNVNWNLVNGVVQLSIRGVSPDGFSTAVDPAVALHIDGVYQPRSGAMLGLVMTDLESVEVLRGPQGTVYGRNANAGVINLNTAKPTDVFEGKATVFGGSYARYGARGYVSGPVTEGISARLTAYVDRNDGFSRNVLTGNRVDGSNSWGVRLAVQLQPTDDVTVDLSYGRSKERTTFGYYPLSELRGANYIAMQANPANDTRYSLAPHVLYNQFDPEQNTMSDLGVATIAWDVTPDITLKSITGYVRYEYTSYLDLDQTGTTFLESAGPGKSRTFSQEINLSAKLFDRVDLVAGLYYMRDNMMGGSDVPVPGGFPYGGAIRLIHNLLAEQTSSTRAAFLDVTVSVTDQLRLLAGVRKTLDHRRTQYESYNLNALRAPVGVPCLRVAPDLDYHSNTGRFGVQYDITPDVMAYVQWQNGFKTGGYNPSQCGQAYQPEHIYSWEGGIKSTFFDDSLQLNISYFDYKYANMQLNRTTFGTSLIDNAASAKLRGAEIEAQAYISDSLKAELGVGILDSKYGNLSPMNNAAAIGNPAVNITGFQLPRAPETTINAALEYTTRIGNLGELTSRGEYSYTSKVFFTAFNEEIASQAGFSLFNAIFTFQPDDSCLTYRAYVRNVADKGYRAGGVTSGILLYGRGTWAPPRTFGGEITAKF